MEKDYERMLGIQHLFEDASFVEKVKACTTSEEMAQLFSENDIEISGTELKAVFDKSTEEEEIDEENLESINGGSILSNIVNWIKKQLRGSSPSAGTGGKFGGGGGGSRF